MVVSAGWYLFRKHEWMWVLQEIVDSREALMLSAEEVEWLRQLGPGVGLNTALLDVFQGGPC